MTSADEVFAFSYNSLMRTLMTMMLAGPKHSRIMLNDDQLRVRMGAGGWMFSADVPRSAVAAAAPSTAIVGGWGAHGWRGRWLVNGSSKGLVRLTIEPTQRARVSWIPVKLRVLTLSLEQPDEFVARFAPAAGAA